MSAEGCLCHLPGRLCPGPLCVPPSLGDKGGRRAWPRLRGQGCLDLTPDHLAGLHISPPPGTPGPSGNPRFWGCLCSSPLREGGSRRGRPGRDFTVGCPEGPPIWKTQLGKGTEDWATISPRSWACSTPGGSLWPPPDYTRRGAEMGGLGRSSRWSQRGGRTVHGTSPPRHGHRLPHCTYHLHPRLRPLPLAHKHTHACSHAPALPPPLTHPNTHTDTQTTNTHTHSCVGTEAPVPKPWG